MFGKPGRPPEDRFLRRREIYMAIAPLLERRGAKSLTMRRVGEAANMSVGGIYHYFASKREVVLFGVSPEMFQRSCEEFHQRYGHLEQADAEWLLADGLDAMVAMVSFARPALVASIELLGAMLDRNASPVQVHDELRAIVVNPGSPGVRGPIGAEALAS